VPAKKIHLKFYKNNMRKLHLILTWVAAGLLAATVTGCTAKTKAAYHLQRANRYFDSGQFDKAEIEYLNVLHDDQSNEQAIGRLGVIYFDEGRFQRAAPFLFKGEELATNNLDLHLKLGLVYLSIGKSKEARDEADFILDRKPQDAEAPLLLAGAATTQNEIAGARQRLQKLSQNGDTAALETALGTIAFREQDFKTAEAALQRAQAIDPKFSAAYTALGALYFALNDLKQAEAAFKTAADFSPPRSPKQLQYAQFETQIGNPAAAKNILADVVKKTPDYIPAWIALAEIALAETNFEDCSASLNKALARDPESYDALLLNGRLDLARGQTAKAMTELERMAALYPQASRVHYQLAVAYLVNDEAEKSMDSLKKALDLEPNFSEATLLLAQLEIKNNDPVPAVISLNQLIARQPKMPQAQLLLADAYRLQGKSGEALAIYQQLEKSFPQNPQVPLLMGSALLQQGNDAEARKEFNRALELSPDSLQALEQLVNLDLLENESAAAMQSVEKAVEKNPGEPVPRLLLAKIFLAQGDTNQAEAALSKVIELQPGVQSAYLLLAQLYFDSKQDQRALTTLGAAIGKGPEDVSALMLSGAIHSDEKDYKGAADAYEKLLQMDPKSSAALNNLAYLYSEYLDQLDKAYDLAQQARALLPFDPSTADTLGWILFKKAQYAPAAALLQESANKLPDEPEVQFHLGMAHYMMDEEDAARSALQRAMEPGRDFPGRDECSRCLSVLAIDPATADVAARAGLEKRIAEKSDDPIALIRLAAIYQRDGIVDKATETYEAALKATPQNVKVMISLAQLYTPKDPQKAFDMSEAAYKLSPNDLDASCNFGRMAYQTGNYKLAFSLLQEAAQNQPDDPKLIYDFAKTAYAVGKISDAQAAVAAALQAGLPSPQSDEAGRFLNLIALSANPAQAVATESNTDEILESDSNYVPALMVMAVISEQKKDFAAAEQNYEKILSQYPDFAPAQRKLAILYSDDSSNAERAYALAVKSRESFPDDPELEKALGILVFRQGDYARAASLLKTSAGDRSADAELFYYLGISQFHLANRVDSKLSLQQALSLGLSGKPAADAREILGQLK
jgi:tetratricopeptide (TPR) repeat protein